MTKRSVSLGSRLEFLVGGTTFANAIALGDVDNDGDIELVVASSEGNLAIFKGDRAGPWCENGEALGTLTCVTVGDVKNTGQNVVVCASAEGIVRRQRSPIRLLPGHSSYCT
eukprot:m.347940 g.347940  ORF g.347940 m.347940 type:complete len:112 (-) comp20672_c1_seq21:63-398(-)